MQGIKEKVDWKSLSRKQLVALLQKSRDIEARRSSNWIVSARYISLPLVLLSFWSRAWIDLGFLFPVTFSFCWALFYSRLFKKPHLTQNWTSRAILGEAIWAQKDHLPIPQDYRKILQSLKWASAVGYFYSTWGMVTLSLWQTLFGVSLIFMSKTWTLDRMTWLHEQMKDKISEFKDGLN